MTLDFMKNLSSKYGTKYENIELLYDPVIQLDLNEDILSVKKFPYKFSKSYNSGWKIEATVTEDYYFFVEKFIAYHLTYGLINFSSYNEELKKGYFMCNSIDAYNHFLAHHKFELICYGDV